MGRIVKQKKPFVNRKAHYRLIAELRKAKWAQKYQLQNEDAYKFHFYKREDPQNEDSSAKNVKGDIRAEQKIKNRMAAQQSREKRKQYVEDLETKVSQYEQLLKKQVCKICQNSFITSSSSQLHQQKKIISLKQQTYSQNYFDQNLIRVQNDGNSTPFSIFFVLCFLAITLFTYQGTKLTDQRILSNKDQLISSSLPTEQIIVKPNIYLRQSLDYYESIPKAIIEADTPQKVDQNNENTKNLRVHNNYSKFIATKDWRRYGQLICTKSNFENNKQKVSQNHYFSYRSASKSTDSQQTTKSKNENAVEWIKGDLLSCIVYGGGKSI